MGEEEVTTIVFDGYDLYSSLRVPNPEMTIELQLFLAINTQVLPQPYELMFSIDTLLEPYVSSYELFSIESSLDKNTDLDDIDSAIIPISLSIEPQSTSIELPISLSIDGVYLDYDISTALLVYEDLSDEIVLDIYTEISNQSYYYELPISINTYPYNESTSFTISTHYSGIDVSQDLFDLALDYSDSSYSESIPISIYLPRQSHESIIFSMMKIPRYDYIYSIYTLMEVVYGIHKSLDSSLIVNSYYLNTDILSETYVPQYDILESLFDIECFMYPYTSLELDSSLEVEVIFTRRDIDCYLYTVLDYSSYLDTSMDVSVDFSFKIHCVLEVDNPLVSLEDIGRVVIFVDPLWRYEPFVLKNAIGTIFNRAVYQNKQRFTLIYGGSPRANFDINKFATIYNIPHMGCNIQYMPTNSSYNKDQISMFTRQMFSFANNELPVINKVFIFSDNPYTHTSSYLSPLYAACKLYKIPIAIITSKGDISGSDPSNPNLYISNHKIDHNYPLEHQPHWTHGAGTKHIDVFDSRTIV